MTPWRRPACGHTSAGYVKPQEAHQPVTAETLTSAWPDRQSVLQGGQEKEAALEAGYGMADYVR